MPTTYLLRKIQSLGLSRKGRSTLHHFTNKHIKKPNGGFKINPMSDTHLSLKETSSIPARVVVSHEQGTSHTHKADLGVTLQKVIPYTSLPHQPARVKTHQGLRSMLQFQWQDQWPGGPESPQMRSGDHADQSFQWQSAGDTGPVLKSTSPLGFGQETVFCFILAFLSSFGLLLNFEPDANL